MTKLMSNNLIKNISNNLIKKLTLALLVSTMAFSAWAISLSDAKQQGLVGEMPNGYLGVVVNGAAAKSLVASINAKRKSIYMNLARKNKITMAQVTALAGKKSLAKTKSGNFIKNATGQWVKK